MSQSNCFSEEIARIKLSATLATEKEVEDIKEIDKITRKLRYHFCFKPAL